MGKMSELAAQLSELKRCGEILIGISDSLADLFSGEPEEKKTVDRTSAKKETEKKQEPKKNDYQQMSLPGVS